MVRVRVTEQKKDKWFRIIITHVFFGRFILIILIFVFIPTSTAFKSIM